MAKTFVGIGFGPIQSGLFLLEAFASGNFERLVVAEVVPEVVASVRRSRGSYWINLAEAGGLRSRKVAGLEIYNPLDAEDEPKLLAAIASAEEIATALPSVEFYDRGTPSPARLLASGFRRKLLHRELPSTVVYAAENDNHAAELLRDAVRAQLDPAERLRLDDRVQFVNTVIGKMSGVVSDPLLVQRDSLVPFIEEGHQAVLVEEFNRILINRIELDGFERGIEVFQEKSDLLPFEEAKLYGHNAAHALMGYLANRRHVTYMHEVSSSDLLPFVEQAFLEESGGALCRRHAGVDALFTNTCWAKYVDDLLTRMINPYLRDRVDRVIRDPRRKLGWNDRLIGTMRLALEQKLGSRRYALGAAAAVELLLATEPNQSVSKLFESIWGSSETRVDQHAIVGQIEKAREELRDFARKCNSI